MAKTVVMQTRMIEVTARYLHEVKSSANLYYIRRVPAAVKAALRLREAQGIQYTPAGDAIIDVANKPMTRVIITTGTTDRKQALKEAHRINTILEAEWDAIVSGKPSSSTVSAAQTLITRYSNCDYDLGDYLDDKLGYAAKQRLQQIDHSTLPAQIKREEQDSVLRAHLSETEWQALQLSRGSSLWTLSAIRDEYIKLKGLNNEASRKDRNTVNGAFKTFIEVLGDVVPSELKKLDMHNAVTAMIASGLKTASVKRKLASVRAAINFVCDMHDVDLGNAFTKVVIPNLNEDKTDRQDFTNEQLNHLRKKITTNILDRNLNPIDGLIAVMMDTGMRVSEALGLQAEDVVFENEVPFVNLHRNTMRRLKTKNSQRTIPLVGSAYGWLEAWKTSGSNAEYVFDHYIDQDAGVLKNDTASATANKRLKAWLGNDAPTCHSFRHTMNTRLRNAGCPKDVREELGGWAKSISDSYGSPHDLRIKREYLQNSIDTDRR